MISFEQLFSDIQNAHKDDLLCVDWSLARALIKSQLNFEAPREFTLDLAKKTACLLVDIASHFEYSVLAVRILIDRLHVQTRVSSFSEHVLARSSEYSAAFAHQVREFGAELDSVIVYRRDYDFDFIGINTLCKNYLARDSVSNEIYESPQDMFMRVSVQLNLPTEDNFATESSFIENVARTYKLLSTKFISVASPILFNAGFLEANLASCFLLGTNGGSVTGVTKTLHDASVILNSGGGVGIDLSSVVSSNLNKKQNPGVMMYLKLFNQLCLICNASGGKRRGSMAFYLPIDHLDIVPFVQSKRLFENNLLPIC